VLALCDGTVTVSDIKLICRNAFGISEKDSDTFLGQIFARFSEALDFLESTEKQGHLCNVKTRIKDSMVAWPYSFEREEFLHEISFVLTERCNHKCSYCFKCSEKALINELKPAEWMRAIDEAAAMGVQEISFTGGEPTLYPGFYDLVRHAYEKSMYPRILTNGVAFCGGGAARLRETGAEYVHLSLPAISQPVFKKVTGAKGTLLKVKRAVADLKKNGFYIRAKVVLTTKNIHEVPEVLDFCVAEGIDNVVLSPFIVTPVSRSGAELIPSVAELLKVRDIAARKRSGVCGCTVIGGPSIGDFQWRGEQNIVRCGGCKQRLVVLSDGVITFCETLGRDPQFQLGDIRHTSLASVWYSHEPDRLTDPREHPVEEPCKSCEHLSVCGTGCLMLSRLYSNNYWSVDPRCFKQKIPGNAFADKRHAFNAAAS
jgi:pyrroloquinoline quinone biosynthesis protein E